MDISMAYLAAGFGAALIIIGAAYGISTLGRYALDGGARQPEVAAHLRVTMIIAAALIEGLAFFALVVCILVLGTKPEPAGAAGHGEKKTSMTAPANPGMHHIDYVG